MFFLLESTSGWLCLYAHIYIYSVYIYDFIYNMHCRQNLTPSNPPITVSAWMIQTVEIPLGPGLLAMPVAASSSATCATSVAQRVLEAFNEERLRRVVPREMSWKFGLYGRF